MDSLRLCSSGGFERDDAFQSDIVASDNADGSWTFYESRTVCFAPPCHHHADTGTHAYADSHTGFGPASFLSSTEAGCGRLAENAWERPRSWACYEGSCVAERTASACRRGFQVLSRLFRDSGHQVFLWPTFPKATPLYYRENTTSRSGGDIKTGLDNLRKTGSSLTWNSTRLRHPHP